ncbi:uncharacterized protein F5147DRAFT_663075 [Suillus discolor]|uniref:Uncharacterized protein n=1 Tax=Suillus discolor TaxID=1912936 RepID=A0A9P7FKK8_9AGAM|nr:uncharacterized protein F5147DRAFT_663075 [Suillus discolor]KAG2120731.1 hypothetical protein F5147DRAFT_663075 [Suillus discolor]
MFATFGLVVNLIVSSMLLLGGSAVVNAITGMNIHAASFLIPLGVCIYVILGGLRATFKLRWCLAGIIATDTKTVETRIVVLKDWELGGKYF